jgi:hypothetical protein
VGDIQLAADAFCRKSKTRGWVMDVKVHIRCGFVAIPNVTKKKILQGCLYPFSKLK